MWKGEARLPQGRRPCHGVTVTTQDDSSATTRYTPAASADVATAPSGEARATRRPAASWTAAPGGKWTPVPPTDRVRPPARDGPGGGGGLAGRGPRADSEPGRESPGAQGGGGQLALVAGPVGEQDDLDGPRAEGELRRELERRVPRPAPDVPGRRVVDEGEVGGGVGARGLEDDLDLIDAGGGVGEGERHDEGGRFRADVDGVGDEAEGLELGAGSCPGPSRGATAREGHDENDEEPGRGAVGAWDGRDKRGAVGAGRPTPRSGPGLTADVDRQRDREDTRAWRTQPTGATRSPWARSPDVTGPVGRRASPPPPCKPRGRRTHPSRSRWS